MHLVRRYRLPLRWFSSCVLLTQTQDGSRPGASSCARQREPGSPKSLPDPLDPACPLPRAARTRWGTKRLLTLTPPPSASMTLPSWRLLSKPCAPGSLTWRRKTAAQRALAALLLLLPLCVSSLPAARLPLAARRAAVPSGRKVADCRYHKYRVHAARAGHWIKSNHSSTQVEVSSPSLPSKKTACSHLPA